MLQFKMEVSKTVKEGNKNVRQKVGDVEVTTPTLDDIKTIVVEAKIKEMDKEGLPVYEDARADWIFGAMMATVKAGARNKLLPGSIDLKPDTSIPTDWDGIIATGERGGGAALAILRDCRAAWAEYVAKLGKSESTQATLIMYFNNRVALVAQPEANRAKMADYVEKFALSLSEEDQEKYTRPIENVISACTDGVAAGDDF